MNTPNLPLAAAYEPLPGGGYGLRDAEGAVVHIIETLDGTPADDFRPIDGPSVATVHRQWLDCGMPAATWVTYVANRQAEQGRNATSAVAKAVTAR